MSRSLKLASDVDPDPLHLYSSRPVEENPGVEHHDHSQESSTTSPGLATRVSNKEKRRTEIQVALVHLGFKALHRRRPDQGTWTGDENKDKNKQTLKKKSAPPS